MSDKYEALRQEMYEGTREDQRERLVHIEKEESMVRDPEVIIGDGVSVGPDSIAMFGLTLGVFEGTIHTHPALSRGSSFSDSDIIVLLSNAGLRWTEVITSDGYVDRLEKTAYYSTDAVRRAFPTPTHLHNHMIDIAYKNGELQVERVIDAIKSVAVLIGLRYTRRALDKR